MKESKKIFERNLSLTTTYPEHYNELELKIEDEIEKIR